MPRPAQRTRYARQENKLGLAAFEADNCEKAIQHFTSAIALDSMFVPAFVNRGNVYKTQNRSGYEKAISDFTSAIQLDSGVVAAYYSRAGAYLAVGNTQKASEDCKACLLRDPDFIEVKCLQAEIETALGNFEVARDMYQVLIEKYPELEEAAVDGRSRALSRMEERKKRKEQGNEEEVDDTLPLLHFAGTYIMDDTNERGVIKASFQFNPETNTIFKVMIGNPPEPSLYFQLKEDFLRITDKDGYVYAGYWRYDKWEGEMSGWGGQGRFKMAVKSGMAQSYKIMSLENERRAQTPPGFDEATPPSARKPGLIRKESGHSIGPLTPRRTPRRAASGKSPLALSPMSSQSASINDMAIQQDFRHPLSGVGVMERFSLSSTMHD